MQIDVTFKQMNKKIDVGVTKNSKELSLNVQGSNFKHGLLTGRDLPNQHPIEAISGLAERLEEDYNILDAKITENSEAIAKSETWKSMEELLRGE